MRHSPAPFESRSARPRRESRRSAPRRVARAVGIAAVLFITFLILSPPNSPARTSGPTLASYAGSVPFTSQAKSVYSPCSRVHSGTYDHPLLTPKVNLKNGRVALGGAVSAGICLAVVSATHADWNSTAGLTGPMFRATASGRHLATYSWELTWQASASKGLGGWAEVNLSVFGNLYDATTHSWVWGGSRSAPRIAIVFEEQTGKKPYSNFSTSTLRAKVVLAFYVNLTRGNWYEFYTGVSAVLQSHGGWSCGRIGCFPTLRGSAELLMGSGPYGARLLSMKLT